MTWNEPHERSGASQSGRHDQFSYSAAKCAARLTSSACRALGSPPAIPQARRNGLKGWTGLVRRPLRARLHGRSDVDELIPQGMSVGREVFIADGAYLDPAFAWVISIGDKTTIRPGVTILTHHAGPKLRTGYSAVARVQIGARVFVGANAVILPGVAIGYDAIVGARTRRPARLGGDDRARQPGQRGRRDRRAHQPARDGDPASVVLRAGTAP